jgi:hypothetical protein
MDIKQILKEATDGALNEEVYLKLKTFSKVKLTIS